MKSTTDIHLLLRKFYNLQGSLKRLAGEEDANYLVTTPDQHRYTLKISPASTEISTIEFQLDILQYLSKQQLSIDIPSSIKTIDNKDYNVLDDGSIMRLQLWLPGRVLAAANPRSSELLHAWGNSMGQISQVLQNYDHPSAHRNYKWNPSETLRSRKLSSYFASEKERKLGDYFWTLFEQQTLKKLPSLRKSINHNDGHELNLLIDYNYKSPTISGIIDFGDALYTATITELAITCAYACMNMQDPLEAACHVIRGYHKAFAIQEEELEVLFALICARLMITVANAAYNKHQYPDNEYLTISERPAWNLLKQLRNIDPNLAHYSFRAACNFSPYPKQHLFDQWVNENRSSFYPITNFKDKRITQLDLSVGSTDLGGNGNYIEIDQFNSTITKIIKDASADYGIGGYLETRPFYTSDAYQVEGNQGPQWRTVHLGLDVWTELDCPVYAPWDATVHSVYDNAGDCNYGPTVILRHEVSSQLSFFTLYGHLSKVSLTTVSKGQHVQKGDLIAYVGDAPINGNWPPHLHFQIILDLLGNEVDFPGVAYPHETQVWSSICPNPEAWFQFEFAQNTTPPIKEIINTRKRHLGRSLSLSYNNPLHIVRGYKQHLYDNTGRRYLDTANNVPHVGHQHPRVTKAAMSQFSILNTNTRYLHKNISIFAKAITETLPPELSVVHFTNSGSEANELALRMAKMATSQKDMLAIEVGYHGNTAACIDVSSYKFDGKGGQGTPQNTHLLPIPDIYRGVHKDSKTAGQEYASYANNLIRNVNVRAENGICIADEVQVGFGRVGTHYWGFQLQDVVPDIITMGKPIGNGHPLGAVVCTPEVADSFANGMEYFNTFGGNPVSCAIGLEVMSIIRDEKLQAHALKVGNYLLDQLQQLQSKYSIIGDVRGYGFFLGMELVRDHTTLEPADDECTYLTNRMRERGILMSTDGPYHNVIKIKPPMCFSKSDADILIAHLDIVLSEDYMRLGEV